MDGSKQIRELSKEERNTKATQVNRKNQPPRLTLHLSQLPASRRAPSPARPNSRSAATATCTRSSSRTLKRPRSSSSRFLRVCALLCSLSYFFSHLPTYPLHCPLSDSSVFFFADLVCLCRTLHLRSRKEEPEGQAHCQVDGVMSQ